MKEQHLPKVINPYSLADRRIHVEGEFQISEMTRVASFLCEDEGQATVSLDFDRDHRRMGKPG